MNKYDFHIDKKLHSAFSLERLKLTERICIDLGNVMNEIHNTSYSHKFWELLLEPYVSSGISRFKYLLNDEPVGEPMLLELNGLLMPSIREKTTTNVIRILKYFYHGNKSKKIKEILSENNEVTIGFPNLQIVKEDLGEALPEYYPLFFGKEDKAVRENYKDSECRRRCFPQKPD